MTLSLKALKPRGAQRLFLFAALGRVPLGLLLAVDAWLMLDSFSYQGLLGVWLLKLAYSPSSLYTLVCVDMLSGPGPPPPPPLNGIPAPGALPAPAPSHANQREREGGRRMIPASASSQSGEPHQSRDRGTMCKQKTTSNFVVW